jgi:hypothetical protein
MILGLATYKSNETAILQMGERMLDCYDYSNSLRNSHTVYIGIFSTQPDRQSLIPSLIQRALYRASYKFLQGVFGDYSACSTRLLLKVLGG